MSESHVTVDNFSVLNFFFWKKFSCTRNLEKEKFQSLSLSVLFPHNQYTTTQRSIVRKKGVKAI